MGDRRISRKHKGNVLSSCVTTEYMNALATMALIEKEQEKVQVGENKERLATNEESVKKKLVSITWAGHVEKNGR